MLDDLRSKLIRELRALLLEIAQTSEQMSSLIRSHANETHIGPVRKACIAAKERAKELRRQLDVQEAAGDDKTTVISSTAASLPIRPRDPHRFSGSI